MGTPVLSECVQWWYPLIIASFPGHVGGERVAWERGYHSDYWALTRHTHQSSLAFAFALAYSV